MPSSKTEAAFPVSRAAQQEFRRQREESECYTNDAYLRQLLGMEPHENVRTEPPLTEQVKDRLAAAEEPQTADDLIGPDENRTSISVALSRLHDSGEVERRRRLTTGMGRPPYEYWLPEDENGGDA